MMMRKYVLAAVLVLMARGAQATLIDRGEGFIYDDVQDITWTQDANIIGWQNWQTQVDWADGYSQTHSVYGTFDDWRLPTTLVPDPTCTNRASAEGYGCTGSEMGHLFIIDGISASSPGLFTSVQASWYWSGTLDLWDGSDWSAWRIHAGGTGTQAQVDWDLRYYNNYPAWAVRDGDIAPIPEPTTALLMGIGLIGLSIKKRAARG